MKKDRILITGFSGFVARHFIQYLYDSGKDVEVWGIDIIEPSYDYKRFESKIRIHFEIVDLLNMESLQDLLTRFVPEYILHLASYSSVAYSWKHPLDSFRNNTNIFLNLVMSIKDINPNCRILSIGSSEEYGNVDFEALPLVEDSVLNPNSPYAVARVSQEMLSKVFFESYDIKIILTRSFNHIGPYQDERFAVPSFIRRIMNISGGGKASGSIETGDISIIRDFVDVRDVVRAYYLLLMQGTPGETYNICSGIGISLKQLIDEIADLLQVNVTTYENQEYVRPRDNKVIVGSAEKIKDELGWSPKIELRSTLYDMIISMKE